MTMNPGLCGQKLATNRFSYCTVLYGAYFDFSFSGNEFTSTLAESVDMKTDTNGEQLSFAVSPDSWNTRLQTTLCGVELTN